MTRTRFLDPERITEHLFGGPHFISGWRNDDGRLFNEDRTKMWFASVVETAWREGFNYTGHAIFGGVR